MRYDYLYFILEGNKNGPPQTAEFITNIHSTQFLLTSVSGVMEKYNWYLSVELKAVQYAKQSRAQFYKNLVGHSFRRMPGYSCWNTVFFKSL